MGKEGRLRVLGIALVGGAFFGWVTSSPQSTVASAHAYDGEQLPRATESHATDRQTTIDDDDYGYSGGHSGKGLLGLPISSWKNCKPASFGASGTFADSVKKSLSSAMPGATTNCMKPNAE